MDTVVVNSNLLGNDSIIVFLNAIVDILMDIDTCRAKTIDMRTSLGVYQKAGMEFSCRAHACCDF